MPIHVLSGREFVKISWSNDVNFDGGYGEDSDFWNVVKQNRINSLTNPFSANLHLKPPAGYRFGEPRLNCLVKKENRSLGNGYL
jgi:hypothetical protein